MYFDFTEALSKKQPKTQVIVQQVGNTGQRTFHIYNIKDMYQAPVLHSHEGINAMKPHKIFFDVDIEMSFSEEFVIKFTQDFISAFQITWNELYSDTILYTVTRDDFIFYTSHGEHKMSFHILALPYLYQMKNCGEMGFFFKTFITNVNPEYKKYYDAGVYSKLKFMRLLGAVKDDRVKVLDENLNSAKVLANHKWSDSLIGETLHNLTVLPELKKKIDVEIDEVNKEMIIHRHEDENILCSEVSDSQESDSEINDFLIKFRNSNYLEGFKFQKLLVMNAEMTQIIFMRTKPSYCILCDRTHESENSLIINVVEKYDSVKSTRDRCFFMTCRRNSDNASKLIHRIGNKTCDDIIVEYVPKTVCDTYDEPTIRDFVKCKTLFIDAPMKMGKTKKLHEFVKANFADPNLNIKILTFRQTFAYAIYEKFSGEGFTLYSDTKGLIDDNRTIIQLESLHRLNIREKHFDLLILDESESIFDQIGSGLFKSFNEAFAVFEFLIKHSAMVICMDAFMSQRTYNIIEQIRGLDNSVTQKNIYQREKDTTMNIYSEYDEWLKNMIDFLDNGKKIAIMCNSKIEARGIKKVLVEKYPQKNIFIYTQDEPQQYVKIEHFRNIDKHWSKYDVLITTPTVSAGVSFEASHYDHVFGYFTDGSCGAETAMQMLGRVRIVKENAVHIFIDYNISYNYPTKIPVIRSLAMNRNRMLTSDYDFSSLSFHYKTNGELQIHNVNYFTIWLENRRIININKTNYLQNMIHLARRSGFKIKICEDNSAGINISDLISDAKKFIIELECNNIAKSNVINEETYMDIHNRLEQLKTCVSEEKARIYAVAAAEKFEYDKYRFIRRYNLDEAEILKIDGKTIHKYNNTRMFLLYVNLNIIAPAYSGEIEIDAVLNASKEVSNFSSYMNSKNIDIFLLNHRVSIDALFCMNSILKIFGWKGIFDDKTSVSAREIYLRGNTNFQKVNRIVADFHTLFNMRQYIVASGCDTDELTDLKQINKFKYAIANMLKKTVNMRLNGDSCKGINKSYRLSKPCDFTYRDNRFHIC